MTQSKSSKTRSSKHKGKDDPKSKKNKTHDETTSATKRYGILTSIIVVGLAYLWGAWKGGSLLFAPTINVKMSSLERLFHYWHSGKAVTVQQGEDGNRCLVATKKIKKGNVAVAADYVDLEGDLLKEHPELQAMVDQLLQSVIQEQSASFVTLTATKILACIRIVQLIDIEQDARWVAWAETIPQNVTSVAWYWTEEERKCIVSRPNDEHLFQNRNVFHAVLAKMAEQSPFVQQIYANPLRAEWAHLMMNTRGFGELFFIPILDMTNHDPLHAVAPFFVREKQKIYLVATHDIQPGEEVYNTYGPLSPIDSAEIYGFVQSDVESAYFEVPSIHRDIWRSEFTNTIPACTKDSVRFFGNVNTETGEKLVEATFGGKRGGSTHFKAFMPTRLAHACIRVLIQSDKDADMARYIAQKLEKDHQRYAVMANAKHCQSTEGNFPLIRKANEVMASLMWDAYEVAEKAANNESIPYPGIPSYAMPQSQQ